MWKIEKAIYDQLLSTPAPPPETGGFLGRRSGVVCPLCRDFSLQSQAFLRYTPSQARLDKAITDWRTDGIQFCGIYHTHPANQRRLSTADRQFITAFLNANPAIAEPFLFPVVVPDEEIVFFQAIAISGHVRIEEIQNIEFIE